MNIANGLDMEMPNGSYSAAEPEAGAWEAVAWEAAADGARLRPERQPRSRRSGRTRRSRLPGGAAQANPGGMGGGRGGAECPKNGPPEARRAAEAREDRDVAEIRPPTACSKRYRTA